MAAFFMYKGNRQKGLNKSASFLCCLGVKMNEYAESYKNYRNYTKTACIFIKIRQKVNG